MKLDTLSDLILNQPWKIITETEVVVEMPDDKSRYAVSAVRFDPTTDSVIIEVA